VKIVESEMSGIANAVWHMNASGAIAETGSGGLKPMESRTGLGEERNNII
jgi:hypothetical protein